MQASARPHVAVVIPCFRVKAHIASVVHRIGSQVRTIYIVDDACTEQSGKSLQSVCSDARVQVLFHETNQGVGGAMISGYRAALAQGADIVVKLDGDGQMDPDDIPALIQPILEGRADYAKGNRFASLRVVRDMPCIRMAGTVVLTLMSRLSSGYWSISDPVNGFTAIHADVLRRLPWAQLEKRFFFESDMLYHLGVLRAVVVDVPMRARYGIEVSNLNLLHAVGEFSIKHLRNFWRRMTCSPPSLKAVRSQRVILPSAIFLLSIWGVHETHSECAP